MPADVGCRVLALTIRIVGRRADEPCPLRRGAFVVGVDVGDMPRKSSQVKVDTSQFFRLSTVNCPL